MAWFDRCALVLIAGGLVPFLGGCGPISAAIAIADAQVALDAADGAGAQTYAIYEYRRAQMNLRQARLEEGYSEFQAAMDLAKEAQSFAEQAKDLALNHPVEEPVAPKPQKKSPAQPSQKQKPGSKPTGGRSL